MPAPTTEFAEALERSSTVLSRAYIQRRDVTGEVTPIVPDGQEDQYLEVAEGASISVDSNRAVRRTLTLPVADTTGLTPLSATSPIAPYGNEVVIEMGIRLTDGTDEYVTVGVFGISDVETNDDGTISLGVTGNDRAQKVMDARLVKPYQILKTTNTATAIQALIAAGVPGLTYSFITTAATTPAMVLEEESDRWDEAQKMAQSDGLELYFDANGICRLSTVADPANPDAPISYTFTEEGILGSVNVKLSTDQTYSHAVVISEPKENTAPFRADAYDTNPSSPTYYKGPFGDKPIFLRSDIITSQSSCQKAANTLLSRKKGGSRNISFTSLPIPQLEGGDLIRITRSESGVDAVFVLDAFNLPLDPSGEMTASVREVQL